MILKCACICESPQFDVLADPATPGFAGQLVNKRAALGAIGVELGWPRNRQCTL
jgi:hypothetical protein